MRGEIYAFAQGLEASKHKVRRVVEGTCKAKETACHLRLRCIFVKPPSNGVCSSDRDEEVVRILVWLCLLLDLLVKRFCSLKGIREEFAVVEDPTLPVARPLEKNRTAIESRCRARWKRNRPNRLIVLHQRRKRPNRLIVLLIRIHETFGYTDGSLERRRPKSEETKVAEGGGGW